jgi:hypothetical protein
MVLSGYMISMHSQGGDVNPAGCHSLPEFGQRLQFLTGVTEPTEPNGNLHLGNAVFLFACIEQIFPSTKSQSGPKLV